MHIIFFADNFPPEGNAIASRVYERACYWVQWGHEVTVITSFPNFPEGKIHPGYKNKWIQVDEMQGIRVVRVKTYMAKNKGFFLRTVDFISYMLPAFIACLFQAKSDVIIATTPHPFGALAAFVSARVKRTPFVLEVADIWPASIVGVGMMRKKNILIKTLEKLELFLYRQADAIIVLTQAFKANLTSRGIAEKKMTVITNGVDLTQYVPREFHTETASACCVPEGKFIVGYIGTHGMAHGLMNVLHTAEMVSTEKNILFMFVGAGAEREALMAYAQSKNMDNVQFIPAQPKHKIIHFWSLCDLALVHLKNDAVFAEVIPSKIFEAMGMGLPICLAAPEGEASAIITQDKVGIWVPAEDPSALAEAIQYMRDHSAERKQFSIKSRERAHFYSREKQAEAVLAVMKKDPINA